MQKDGCDFRLKTINEDFRVVEVPLLPDFEPTSKTFTYLWIKKPNYTTFEVSKKLAKFFDLNFNDVVAEGLKDNEIFPNKKAPYLILSFFLHTGYCATMTVK